MNLFHMLHLDNRKLRTALQFVQKELSAALELLEKKNKATPAVLPGQPATGEKKVDQPSKPGYY